MGLGLVLLLIAINGFFVAGEFSLVAVNRSRVESQASQGDRRAVRLLARLKNLSFELSGAQLGITVTSLIIGALAESTVAELLAPLLEAVGISSSTVILGVALVAATLFQMVIGELFPKNLAIARPYPTAMRVGLAMGYVNGILGPIIRFFNAAANWTVRLTGIEPREELAGLRSLQELELIVRASSAEGELDDQEEALLTRAIGFIERNATDAMVARVDVIGVASDATLEEVRALAVETGHSRFPVYEGTLDTVVGIAYVKDTLAIPRREHGTIRVGSLATSAEVVPESIPLDTLLLQLQRLGRTMAVVVDEYGGTAGIVSIEDIVEEILGEIEDEYDVPEMRIVGPSDTVNGGMHRREVQEATGFEWPTGSYETLSGFVTANLERFPEPGDVVESEGYRIEVVTTDGPVADSLRVRPTKEDLS